MEEKRLCSYEITGNGIAVMKVNNPPMNALGEKTINDITASVQEAIDDPQVRVIVLTAEGRAFVAGADITEFADADTPEKATALAERGHRMNNLIEGSDKPVICAINGFCLGGGLELAMSCHIRIASEKAKLGVPEITLGIIPGFAGTQRLSRIVGKAGALEMILTGSHLSAVQALEMGLVNRVVEDSALMDASLELAGTIASKGRLAVKAALDSVMRGAASSFEDGSRIEMTNFARVKMSEDSKEGVSAFLEKRPPEFRDM